MSNAAFQATYADFKLIKTRGVVSVSFELPVEQARLALDVLGGMPVAASEVWCAIARLNPGADAKEVTHGVTTAQSTEPKPRQEIHPRPSGGAKRTFHELSYAQQAGILCGEIRFRRFMEEKYQITMTEADGITAQGVRLLCGVKSRSELMPKTQPGWRFERLVDEYQAWKLV